MSRGFIMLVDDEKDLTDAMKAGLEQNGYRVSTFNDGRSAREHYSPGRYDLVITDIRMPGMNGFELYRELSKLDREVRICFLTGFDVSKEEFFKLFPETRVQHLFRKPVMLSKIVHVINEILAKRTEDATEINHTSIL